MHNERRPKPLRGMGYGDIFAAGAPRPLPADPPIGLGSKTTSMSSEQGSTASLTSTLQKPIPKKPPPPAPADISGTNGSPFKQAPALPPKPSNQFNPFFQQHQRPLPQITQQRTVIEKVQVIYAYKPSNSDELEMEVGDIIDVLDKNIEDQGWWRGELKGKIGVFPDNFVQPLEPLEPPTPTSPGKLNHITANRAKGPTRRPPKNILNKRNQLNESTSSNESKHEQQLKDVMTSAASSVDFNQTTNSNNPNTIPLPQNVVYPEPPSLPAMSNQQQNNVTKELNELRMEVKKLQQDFKGIEELKLALEGMKIELRACQSATESQRKFIKELVNNLADERKKIAAMQVELDRNLN
jgi:hypothetical protein